MLGVLVAVVVWCGALAGGQWMASATRTSGATWSASATCDAVQLSTGLQRIITTTRHVYARCVHLLFDGTCTGRIAGQCMRHPVANVRKVVANFERMSTLIVSNVLDVSIMFTKFLECRQNFGKIPNSISKTTRHAHRDVEQRARHARVLALRWCIQRAIQLQPHAT